MNKSLFLHCSLLIAVLLSLAGTGTAIPVSSAQAAHPADDIAASLPALEEFIQQVALYGSTDVTGVYVPDLFATKVIQQPASSPGYISSASNEVTQFNMAARYGVTGLLAHNYLAGGAFFNLQAGSLIYLVRGDGTLSYFQITAVRRFQATNPSSPYSDFIDLDDPTNTIISSSLLFNDVYTQSGRLVLQTCIADGAQLSWGRLFILADPITSMELLSDPQPVDWGALTATT